MPDDAASDPVARARALGPVIDQAVDEIERTRRLPAAVHKGLINARLLRMLLPKAAGGDEIVPSTYLDAVIEIARHDASVGWNIFVANSATLIAPFLDPEVARTIYRDPAALIAWGPPNQHRAKAVDGGYIVNGRWDFASGCRQANWMGAHCSVVERDGSLRQNSHGRNAVLTFLFPIEKAILLDTWNTIGLKGTASDSYRIEELFVPEAYTTTREEPTQRREPGPLYAFTMQGLYAVGVAGVALGVAREMLTAFVDLASRKSPRSLGRLCESAAVQSGVGRWEARIGSARAYLIEVLDDIYARAPAVTVISTEDRGRVRLACANAIHGAIEVCDAVYKAAGVDAIFPGSPFERRFRDIHTLSQQIQSRDAHFEAVGQILLGNPPAVFF
jgi:alkylation response protein AidB-like acyl-CoA dehydrogenase